MMITGSWSGKVRAMQISQTPPVKLEVLEGTRADEREESAPYPANRPLMAKAGKQSYLPYLLFALCASLYFVPFMRILLPGDGDEGLLVSGAVRVAHGQVFARDFFEVVGPGTFYWLALFFKLFGTTFVATRICLFITSLGTGLAMYFISRRICKQYQALPCILLAGTYFGSSWPAISHHVDSNFFALLAVACMIVWHDKHKLGLLFAAGALAGATTCILQPKGILLMLALLVWLWLEHRRRSASLLWLGVTVGGYASVVALMLVYFWSRHALWGLFYANVLWPARNYSGVNVVPYAQGIIHYYWDHFVIAKSGFRWTVITASILILPFFVVATLPAMLPVLAISYRRNAAQPEILLLWLCGVALWLSEFHRKDIPHLVFGSPLLMILFVFYLQQYRAKIADLALQILAISATCLAGFNLFLVLSARPVATRAGSVALLKSDPVINALQSEAKAGEEIFAYPYCAMYYFLSATTNPTRYAALLYNFNDPSQFEEVVRTLEQRRVKLVVWNTSLQKNMKDFFPGMKKVPDDQLIVEPYLRTHYKVVWADADTRIMERNIEDHAN
jgi:4-amino-4-deoxy-L-arabinose transferase-like glycosyltransferase